jgi:hypothetical protein
LPCAGAFPRILGTIGSDPRARRARAGVSDDSRFEVRYQCGRAIDRLLIKDPSLHRRRRAHVRGRRGANCPCRSRSGKGTG